MEINNIYKKFSELGVSNPKNPSRQDKKIILKKFLNKEVSQDVFNKYINIQDLDPKDLINGIKDMTSDSKDVSKKVLDLCDKAITIFKDNLDKAETQEERNQVRQDIIDVLNKGREESDTFKKQTIMLIVSVGAILGLGGKLVYDNFIKG